MADSINSPYPYTNSQVFKTTDGIHLHYRVWDKTPDEIIGYIFLVHGFCGSTFSWRDIAPHFESLGYVVVAADIPPFGYSDRTENANHSPSARAGYAWELLAAIYPSQKWILMGHSMGASVTGAMAALRPQAAEAIVFVAGYMRSKALKGDKCGSWYTYLRTGIDPSSVNPLSVLRLIPTKPLADLTARHIVLQPNFFELFVRHAYGKRPSPEVVEHYRHALLQPRTADALIEMLTDSVEVADYSIQAIKCPALIIWGTRDNVIPVWAALSLEKKLHHPTLVRLRGLNHCFQETDPTDFLRVVTRFLRRVID
jgi:pimeloyl-ACP methyl ester carboxylesterase